MLGLARMMASSQPTRWRRFGAGGLPLTLRQQTSLQRWQADFEALASGAAANQSLADILQLPQMLQRLGSSSSGGLPLLQAALAGQYGGQYGAALDQLSALYHDNHTSFGGADNIVLGGFARLPQSFAPGLGSSLRLRSPVVQIRHGDSSATVRTASGQELTAQYVICTVPLGVLRAGGVQLEPPLPAETEAALGRLGVGRLEKLWLEFDAVSGGLAGAGWLGAAGGCTAMCVLSPTSSSSSSQQLHALPRHACRRFGTTRCAAQGSRGHPASSWSCWPPLLAAAEAAAVVAAVQAVPIVAAALIAAAQGGAGS